MSQVSRRTFMRATGAGVAGTAIASNPSSYARILGANERVRVGLVGFDDAKQEVIVGAK